MAQQPLTTNQGFRSLVCNEDLAIPEFLFYSLKANVAAIESVASGATFREISGKALGSFKVPLPTLATQRRVVAILSAYDDLIENSLRRIEIPEEMARNLYREWFVEFRFPGHERAPFVDSPLGRIPEGWLVAPLHDLVETQPCPSSTRSSSSAPAPAATTRSGRTSTWRCSATARATTTGWKSSPACGRTGSTRCARCGLRPLRRVERGAAGERADGGSRALRAGGRRVSETKLACRLNNAEKSLARLEAVARKPLDEEYVNLDATVHRFNVAFETLLKALDAHLASVRRMSPAERGRSNFERLRAAFRVGLIDDDRVWTRIRRARNATVHEVDQEQALALYRAVKTYVPYLRALLERMRAA